MAMHMLTTIDNPYSPVTQYREWYTWDAAAGYHTPGLLARIVRSSDDLSEPDRDAAEEAAIDEIIRENVLGIFRKVEVPES